MLVVMLPFVILGDPPILFVLYIFVKYKISIISMKHSNFKKFLKFYDLQHMWWNKNANLSQNLHNE